MDMKKWDLEYSEKMKKMALEMWRDNRRHLCMTLDVCFSLMKSIRSHKDLSKHQNATDNYEVALRVMDTLMTRILLDGDDESLKSTCSDY